MKAMCRNKAMHLLKQHIFCTSDALWQNLYKRYKCFENFAELKLGPS